MAVGNFKHTPVEYNEESLDQQNRKSGRVYVDERGNEYPSITRVLSILNKDAIIAWRKRVGEEEANRISTKASKRGTKVHGLIEKFIANEEWNVDVNLLDLQVMKDVTPAIEASLSEVFAIEKKMYSEHLGVAGTVDCVGIWNNKRSIIDWKTSRKWKKKEWISGYFMQSAAYAIMWEERTGMPIKNLVICIAGDEGVQIFEEDRDDWTQPLIDTISEFKRRNK
tara:strand:- start:1423 stop:2094 length:672 start_codon:yes stop_codon:yes gene_type:complete